MNEEQNERNPVATATASPADPANAVVADIEQVFREHRAYVFRVACRVTGNTADAEDVMQTVFLGLLRRDQSDPIGSLESYLYRAAVNSALDIVRARRGGSNVPLEEVAAWLAEDPSRAPDRARSSTELRNWLRAAIGRLSPRAAGMFVLRFFEGMDNIEVARIFETTPGTVAVTISRTRDQLERELRSFQGGNS
jgi:RNA polymerase sigma-70 factor, ECF subfamily